MKIGVADYGMQVWDGGFFDYEERWNQLKLIGYEGIERLTAFSCEEALNKAARMRKDGMAFTTVRGPSVELSIKWTAGLGKDYVWIQVTENQDFQSFYRQVNIMTEACRRSGIYAAIHNHMGTLVETQEQLENFLEACPFTKIVFDTGHLAAMGGDCVEIVQKYANRIQVIHVKDWFVENDGASEWYRRGRFCGLGKGNIGIDTKVILDTAVQMNYNGWVYVEHDTHLQDPLIDLTESRDYLRKAGY